MSKKVEKASNNTKHRRVHGATCGACAKPRRYKKETETKRLVKELEGELERYCDCHSEPEKVCDVCGRDIDPTHPGVVFYTTRGRGYYLCQECHE